jgi:energy-coupling factor transporter transmembrane protein EcfT
MLLTLLSFFFVHSRPGGLTGVMLFYLAPLFIAVLAIVAIIVGFIASIKRRPFFTPLRIVAFATLILLCFSAGLYNKYPSIYDNKPSKVAFRIPLDTTVTVAWGGGNEQVNYHVAAPDQCWAYDLLVTRDGKSFSGDSTKLENYYCYGLPVLAPAAGKIVKAYDADPDMPVGELGGGKEPVGNHVILEVAPKEFLFICHLQPKSIKVKVGDIVKQGQELALVGNSGNTSEPHIHMHLQDTDVQGIGEGIPMHFYGYDVNGRFVEKGIPTGGIDGNGKATAQTIRHVKPISSDR